MGLYDKIAPDLSKLERDTLEGAGLTPRQIDDAGCDTSCPDAERLLAARCARMVRLSGLTLDLPIGARSLRRASTSSCHWRPPRRISTFPLPDLALARLAICTRTLGAGVLDEVRNDRKRRRDISHSVGARAGE